MEALGVSLPLWAWCLVFTVGAGGLITVYGIAPLLMGHNTSPLVATKTLLALCAGGRGIGVLLLIGFLALVVLYVELLGEHEITQIEADNLAKALEHQRAAQP